MQTLEYSLQTRLESAVESLLGGLISRPQLLEALDHEFETVSHMQTQAPPGETGQVLDSALAIYLDCLLQLEDLVAEEVEFDHDQLAPLYSQAATANQLLDVLTEPEVELDSGWLV